MRQKKSQKKSDKVNEIIQTLKLLGIGTKSFSINFDELSTYIQVNNQRLPEHHGAYQKTDRPPAP